MTECCVTNLFVDDTMIYAYGDSETKITKLLKWHQYIVSRESSEISQQQI